MATVSTSVEEEQKALIIIPTYNERDNVTPLSETILRTYPNVELLFIDDNSPDGTGALLDVLAAREPRIHVLHRPGKLGLGTAYVTGFKWALARDYVYIFEMDADFSHDPKYIADFLSAIRDADLVLGSRYTVGVSVINWTLPRLLISKLATLYVRLITGMPASDATGGFKCFRRRVLESLDLDRIRSNGYSFQIEMTYYTWMAGFRIREIPIIFYERAGGVSKMNKAIVREAIWVVWRLWFKHLFRRKPPRTPFYQPPQPASR
ncbi:MAG: polyprenol monophosphomannose synthase [bacterium]|nr:polyprenol monophosphomannose synthase [bacterium]